MRGAKRNDACDVHNAVFVPLPKLSSIRHDARCSSHAQRACGSATSGSRSSAATPWMILSVRCTITWGEIRSTRRRWTYTPFFSDMSDHPPWGPAGSGCRSAWMHLSSARASSAGCVGGLTSGSRTSAADSTIGSVYPSAERDARTGRSSGTCRGLVRFMRARACSCAGSMPSTSTCTRAPFSKTTPRSSDLAGPFRTHTRTHWSERSATQCSSVIQRPPPPASRCRRRHDVDDGGGSTKTSRFGAHPSRLAHSTHSTCVASGASQAAATYDTSNESSPYACVCTRALKRREMHGGAPCRRTCSPAPAMATIICGGVRVLESQPRGSLCSTSVTCTVVGERASMLQPHRSTCMRTVPGAGAGSSEICSSAEKEKTWMEVGD